MQISETKSIIVGGVVVLIAVLTFAFVSSRHNLESGPGVGKYRVNAMFNRVDGLHEGDEVRLGGIKIGTVSTQALDNNYRAIIGMDVDAGIKLPMDTSAAIHTDSLFGSKFVVLEPGGDEELLASGDTITFTQDSMIVSDLLDQIIAEGERTARESAAAQKKLRAIEKAMGKQGTN